MVDETETDPEKGIGYILDILKTDFSKVLKVLKEKDISSKEILDFYIVFSVRLKNVKPQVYNTTQGLINVLRTKEVETGEEKTEKDEQ
jgi:hypothetical protein